MNQILYRDFLPSTRWDVLEWNYFEETELFSCQSQEVKCKFPDWLESEISDAKAFVKSISESLRNCFFTSSLSGYYDTLNDHTRYLIDYDGPDCDASLRFDLIRKTTGFELVNKLEFSHAPMPLIVVLIVSKHNADFLPKFLNTLKNFKNSNLELLPVFITNPTTTFRSAKDRLAKSGLALVNKNAASADLTWHSTSSDVLFEADKREAYLKVLFEGINNDSAFITIEPSDIISEDLLDSCSRIASKENLSTVNIGFQFFSSKFRESMDNEIAKNEGFFNGVNTKTVCSTVSNLKNPQSKQLRKLDPNLRFRSLVYNCSELSTSDDCINIQSKALGKRSSLGKWYTENNF
ncbi:unnamed protein product [Oikopleura dioica]|uniref:Hexosyltransferase n=1 Tax=Oikopleura dioica TaxID=34765 RepID=E4X165_OIKDI|nr:unnamed protein product [Oikopleura dioica]